jgi:diguanylate cyclase
MIETVYINISMNFLILFLFFQMFFHFQDYITSKWVRSVIIGLGFGLAQSLFRVLPIRMDDYHEFVFIGGTTFITAAVFGGSIASFISGFTPLLIQFLMHHSFDSRSFFPQLLFYFIVLMSFSFLKWKPWKIWLLLNLFYQIHLLFMINNTSFQFHLIRITFEIICASIIYYLVFYIYQSHETKKTLERHALTDALTGLYNLRFFKEILSQLFADAKHRNSDLVLMMIDIDFFKKVNDTYGHPAGDQVLIQVATIMEKSFRDIGVTSRQGGEEFAVILPSVPLIMAVEQAEIFREQVEQYSFRIPKHPPIHITVSIGLAYCNNEYTRPEELLAVADKQLYQSKENGRNHVSSN